MRTLIACYSRTGNTRKAAEALADRFAAPLAAIPCDRYEGAPRGLVRAGHDSVHGEAPEIDAIDPDPASFDRIVLGGPVWVWVIALPLRSFLRRTDLSDKRVGIFVTYGGGPHGRPLDQLEMALGRPPVARAAFAATTLSDESRLTEAVTRFAREIDAAG